MAAAAAFKGFGDVSRDLWLFDTFEGMARPDDADRRIGTGEAASELWRRQQSGDGGEASDWCMASMDDVARNLALTDYPTDRIRLIKGKVEETLHDPANIPEQIALLRLDTDWYESTKVEMEVLFDRLKDGGVLILDDYGAFQGAKLAADQFIAENNLPLFLSRIDVSVRLAVKPPV